jgi:hypothetical protein
MVLKLDIIVFLAEEVSIPQRCCFGALIMACGTSPAKQADRQIRPS